MKFVCEFALENARNSVLELQKCKNFLGEDPQTPPFLQKLSMRVPINHKKLYYNYYTYNPPTSSPPPQTSDALLRPRWLYSKPISVLRYP